MTEIVVPPYLARFGAPYWPVLLRFRVVTPLIVSPKFQTQAPTGNSPSPTLWPFLLVSGQNGEHFADTGGAVHRLPVQMLHKNSEPGASVSNWIFGYGWTPR